jgi:stage V sporulation protein D (sporulation-specific penicillin-binding protein)
MKQLSQLSQLSQLPDKWMKMKLYYVVTVTLIAFMVYIGFNLYQTSVADSEYYRMRANNQQLDPFELNANRGTIYDRNGKILAKSTTVWDVILSPYDIKKARDCPKEISRMLAEVLELDYEHLLKLCEEPDNRYQVIKRRIDKDAHDRINRRKAEDGIGLYSVYLVENTRREYPHDRLASNIVGFTDYDNIGQYGVEAFYDSYLQGRNGRLLMLKDGVGRTMSSEFERRFDAVDGNNVYMTIDVVLQHNLEKHLETIVKQHNVANRATGIMMEPNTGAILAMATTMGYNPNSPTELSEADEYYLESYRQHLAAEGFEEDEIRARVQNERAKLWELQWRNKSITELYYPGSVFKTVTAAAALEEKVASIHSGYHCGGRTSVLGVNIGCWHAGGHGSLDFNGALTKSCNPAFIDMSAKLGTERFYNYLEAFGFTQKTGVDLFAEAHPIVTKRNEMTLVDLATSSFGQTNKITPLQMITGFAACINGGYLVTPHVVDRITDNDGNVIKSNSSGVKRQILSRETSDQMRVILENVVKANGGSNAYMPGYRIGGKSGTSQKLDEYPEDHRMRYVASFCAFAPSDNPKVIMLVVVDEPNPGGQPYYGSLVAAPVVSAVFKESFQHLEIYPQFTAEEQAMQDTVVPNLMGQSTVDATARLSAVGLNARFEGEGRRVVRTVPAAGAPIRQGSTVVLYLEDAELLEVEVPDVHGMNVAQATRAITDVGLNIRLTGGAVNNTSAIAVFMAVEPGKLLKKGEVVDVQFAVSEGHGG